MKMVKLGVLVSMLTVVGFTQAALADYSASCGGCTTTKTQTTQTVTCASCQENNPNYSKGSSVTCNLTETVQNDNGQLSCN